MNETPLTDEELAAVEQEWAGERHDKRVFTAMRHMPRLIADLRAARAEIENLKGTPPNDEPLVPHPIIPLPSRVGLNEIDS